MTDGAEDSGRRHIVVTVIASGVNDGPGVLSLRLCMLRGVGHLILTIFNAYCLKTHGMARLNKHERMLQHTSIIKIP